MIVILEELKNPKKRASRKKFGDNNPVNLVFLTILIVFSLSSLNLIARHLVQKGFF
tara:strand:+ start:854 stop:1021 length:168 start_codon:yes stop_codon:yes gene_type:complete